ncbi:YaiO family outer membrane beta-barrel protein [Sphingobacterium sp. SG20118]|uniref:YaiO family outer membrane beta-barrel protein n=1 Tax=Sphingobacterium sp. SG20118 TaxID=3367156 RepID=UPI0037DFC677
MNKTFYILFCLIALPLSSFSQGTGLTADELFVKARTQAFDHKNYVEAIKITNQALQQAPDYTDIAIFLGRLYTWSNQIDSARTVFEKLNNQNVKDEDFYMAYASLEYWNDQSNKAIQLINKGILHHPESQDLLLLKTKIDYSNSAYDSAEQSVIQLLTLNPKNSEARILAKNIREYTAKNAIGLNYNFVHFDKQFDDNWHIVALSYKRATPLGSIIFRTNYANKFADDGLQFELEAYPRLSKMFYLYVAVGYSNNVSIFPKYRNWGIPLC